MLNMSENYLLSTTAEPSTRLGTIASPSQLAALSLIEGLIKDDPETAHELLVLFIISVTPKGFWSALEEASGEKCYSLVEKLAQEFADDVLGEGEIQVTGAEERIAAW